MSRQYRQIASDIAEIENEQNEAYVAPPSGESSGSQSSILANRQSSGPDNSGERAQANRPNTQSSNEASPNNAGSVERIDGFDEIFDPAVSTDYECPVCMLVLRNPVQTQCGHRFCAACINRHIETNGQKCPIDNQELKQEEIYADNFAKREISQFKVKCRTLKNKKDCPWTGTLQSIEGHLKTCEFVEVPCPKGCNQNVERNALDNHLKKECAKRTVTCTHCKTEVQHKNYKDHLGKCQKVSVSCPNCNKKMLREKLIAGHEKECPKAQTVCDFRQYGCKWTGIRAQLQNHLSDEASIRAHLSMIGGSLTPLIPANGQKSKGSALKPETSVGGNGRGGNGAASGNALDELSRQRNRNAESIATLEAKVEQMERKYRDLIGRTERQHRENDESISALKKSVVELEARMCNGVYLWRINDYSRHLDRARDNTVTALHSPPFYTNFYGYKLCLRINPNGVDTGYGSHISLFVHMMQSDWDDTLEWPFSGRISLSILDQSDDGEYKRHISETLVTRPTLLAFQRPTTPRNHKGYGYVEFAHIETLQDRQYLKNDCLLIRVQVFQ